MFVNEFIMTSLRTSKGLSFEVLRQHLSEDDCNRILLLLQKYIRQGSVSLNAEIYVLTRQGKLFADAIISDLFFV